MKFFLTGVLLLVTSFPALAQKRSPKIQPDNVGIYVDLPLNSKVTLEETPKYIRIVGDTLRAIAYMVVQLNKKEDMLQLTDQILLKIMLNYKFSAETRKMMDQYIMLRTKQE